MKQCISLFIFVFLFIFHSSAQIAPNQIHGRVTFANSEFQPVDSVMITAVGAVDTTYTDMDGKFILTFVKDIPEGVIPKLRIEKKGAYLKNWGNRWSSLIVDEMPANRFFQIYMTQWEDIINPNTRIIESIDKNDIYGYEPAWTKQVLAKYEQEYKQRKEESIISWKEKKLRAISEHSILFFNTQNLDLFNEAMQLIYQSIAEGKFEKAISLLDKHTPNETLDVFETKAHLYAYLGNETLALENYQKAVEIAPENVRLLFEFAYFLDAIDEDRKSAKMFKKTLKQAKSDEVKRILLVLFRHFEFNKDNIAKRKVLTEKLTNIHINLIYQYPYFYHRDGLDWYLYSQFFEQYEFTAEIHKKFNFAELYACEVAFDEIPSKTTAQDLFYAIIEAKKFLYEFPEEKIELLEKALELYQNYGVEGEYQGHKVEQLRIELKQAQKKIHLRN